MNVNEMMQKMQELGISGTSALHMRSESIQTRQTGKRIPMLKKGLKKKSKLLIVCDLALPFNPVSGEADKEFNADNKYRPPFSATTVALYLKSQADSNERLKSVLMQKAGVTEWDTSNADIFTKEDWNIFAKYRVPRVFTVPVVNINIPAMNTGKWGRDYAISVQRDPLTGEIAGEEPLVLKVNKLFRDRCFEELKDYQDKLDRGELNHTDEQQKTYRQNIFQKNPVSDDHPANWVQIIELPLTPKYELSADITFAKYKSEDLEEFIVLSRLNKKLKEKLTKYKNGELEKYDKYFDFYELDMACPTEGDENSDSGKQQIGLNTDYEKPDNCISDETDSDMILALIRDYLDSKSDIEEAVRRSLRITPYGDVVENQLITAVTTVLDLDDPFITDAVIKANGEVITLIFGDEGMELLESADAGVSGRKSGELDEKDAATESKKYDLNADEFTDDATESADVETFDPGEIPFN